MHSGGRQASCPSCGGPIEFKLGSSAALVCPWCRFSVVRTDRDLQAIGKVADLVPTAPVMTVGDQGSVDGRAFVVGGRLQLDHGAGPWDEWYVELPRERRWGWLAKAQGKWYLTFPAPEARPPAWEQMNPGSQGRVPGTGEVTWTVGERGESRLVSAEGELPFAAIPGASGRYVDLVAPGGGFATIDYGDGSAPPATFVGTEIAHEALTWKETAVGARPTETVQAGRLDCPTCGAPVPIRVPEQTERAACASCHSLLDFEQGHLRLLAQLEQTVVEPFIPLGTVGRFRGVDLTCIGLMERCTVVDGVTYAWREYLLHTDRGFRWLLEDSGHFTWLEPISPADVHLHEKGAEYAGRTYKTFQVAHASVRYVAGEFYWKVQAGEQAHLADHIAPPYILSEERNARESIWSHGEYVPGAEIWSAFDLPGDPPRPWDVAPAQPNPAKVKLPLGVGVVGVALLLVVFLVLSHGGPEHTLVEGPIDMPAAPDSKVARRSGAPAAAGLGVRGIQRGLGGTREEPPTTPTPDGKSKRVAFTPTFELPPEVDAVEVKLTSNLGRGWLGVACALIHERSRRVHEFVLEQDRYHESGPVSAREPVVIDGIVGDLEPGPYVLRLDPRWVRQGAGATAATPPQASISVQTTRSNSGRTCCCVVSGVLLLAPFFLATMRRLAFEQRRWRNSNLV